MADIFYTSFERIISTYDTYVEHYAIRTANQVATLAFSYRFGHTKLAPATPTGPPRKSAAPGSTPVLARRAYRYT